MGITTNDGTGGGTRRMWRSGRKSKSELESTSWCLRHIFVIVFKSQCLRALSSPPPTSASVTTKMMGGVHLRTSSPNQRTKELSSGSELISRINSHLSQSLSGLGNSISRLYFIRTRDDAMRRGKRQRLSFSIANWKHSEYNKLVTRRLRCHFALSYLQQSSFIPFLLLLLSCTRFAVTILGDNRPL